MPGTDKIVGAGATVTFGTSGYTAKIADISWNGASRKVIPVPDFSTAAPTNDDIANMPKILSTISDGGQFSIRVYVNSAFGTTARPPLDDALETVTFKFPKASGDSTSASLSFTGACVGWDMDVPLEDAMTATLKVEICSTIAATTAS